jgi:hypothetical protein
MSLRDKIRAFLKTMLFKPPIRIKERLLELIKILLLSTIKTDPAMYIAQTKNSHTGFLKFFIMETILSQVSRNDPSMPLTKPPENIFCS